jgi:flavodoxin
MEEYDIIFIGFPNWWGTMPMPILTFLESYKLEGKIVIPFCTHGGGGEQSCFKDFVKNTSKATNKKGFITSGGAASSARPQVEKWLKEIDIINK